MWVIIGVFIGVLAAGAAGAWAQDADALVESFNTDETRQEFGLVRVERGERSSTRLEVVFEKDTPAHQRYETLKELGERFLKELWSAKDIPIGVGLEEDAAGRHVQTTTVTVTGSSIIAPSMLPQVRMQGD